MLESAEIGHRIAKKEYEREEPKLRKALLNAQYDLSQSGRGPVLVPRERTRAPSRVPSVLVEACVFFASEAAGERPGPPRGEPGRSIRSARRR